GSATPSLGESFMHNLGAMRRGKARSYFDVIARSEATKQSILAFMSRDGLLRFARNDDPFVVARASGRSSNPRRQ
nr:hypothetical protein [Bradyrhizobium sp.]